MGGANKSRALLMRDGARSPCGETFAGNFQCFRGEGKLCGEER
jgi:hypothetical protein